MADAGDSKVPEFSPSTPSTARKVLKILAQLKNGRDTVEDFSRYLKTFCDIENIF